MKEGFSMNVMRQKEESKVTTPPTNKTAPPIFTFNDNEEDKGDENAAETLAILSENTSKTTAVVQVTGALDVMITPLLLESLQRLVLLVEGFRGATLSVNLRKLVVRFCKIQFPPHSAAGLTISANF